VSIANCHTTTPTPYRLQSYCSLFVFLRLPLLPDHLLLLLLLLFLSALVVPSLSLSTLFYCLACRVQLLLVFDTCNRSSNWKNSYLFCSLQLICCYCCITPPSLTPHSTLVVVSLCLFSLLLVCQFSPYFLSQPCLTNNPLLPPPRVRLYLLRENNENNLMESRDDKINRGPNRLASMPRLLF
jgi:hypothetical protein